LKSSHIPRVRARRFALRPTIAWPVLVAYPMLCLTAFAGGVPSGAIVTAGKATVTTKAGAMVVNQASQRGIVKWSDFSISQGNKVTFVQPDSGSATLNIVTGPNASLLAGALQANGSVYLVNPNGITIGPSGLIDTGAGFIASTLGIADADFMNGKLRFSGQGGAVVNQGTINAGSGGAVVLLGGTVSNEGVINAPLGKVGFGAGSAATLDLKGDGFLQVVLPSGATTSDGQALVSNAGTIAADGGMVMLKASTVADAMRNAVNMPGTIRASSVSGHDGEIVLEGGAGGTVTVSGTLDASAAAGAVNGGKIDISGNTIALQGATVAATGVARGGEVRIGGAFQGGKAQDPSADRTELYIGRFGATTALQNATQTDIDAASSIDVSANGAKGIGGTAIVWSDQRTTMLGRLLATGAGAGGAIEVSSASTIQSIDLARIRVGGGGTLLLDPQEIVIDDTEAPGTVASTGYANDSGTTTLLNSADVVAQLSAGTNLILQASDNINWTTTTSVVTPASGHSAGTLTLAAGNSISLNGAFTTGGAQWNMTANDVSQNGVVGAERLAGAADLDLSQAVFSGNNGLLNLKLEDGNGNAEQDADSLRLGSYSGAGITAWVRSSAQNTQTLQKANIVLAGDITTTGDITLTGDLLFNAASVTLSAAHVNWDASATIRGESIVKFVEGGVLTHYGSMRGGDAVRMDLGQAVLPTLTRQYGDQSIPGYTVASQLHVDANSAVQPGDALSAILTAGSISVTQPGIYTPVGSASVAVGASASFGINNGLQNGYFFDLTPAALPVTITPRLITPYLYNGSTYSYTYGSPLQLFQLGASGSNQVLSGDDVGIVTAVNGSTGIVLSNGALSTHWAAGTSSVAFTGLTGASASNYALTGNTSLLATVNIAQKALDYSNGTSTQTYGSAVLSGPALVGIVSGDDVAGIPQVTTITPGTAGASGDVPVGVYQVGYSGLGGTSASNYQLQYTRYNTVTVEPRTLTVQTSAAADTVYGTLATLNATLNGVVPGDVIGVNNQTSLLDSSGNAAALSATTPAGTYQIGVTTSGLTGTGASNYTIASSGNTFGSLVVSPKALTWGMSGTALYYGDALAYDTSTFVGLNGLVGGDTLTPGISIYDGSGNVVTRPDAGQYAAAVTSLSGAAAGNYVLSSTGNQPGVVTINPRLVSYTISDQNTIYGTTVGQRVTLTNVLPGETVGYTETLTSNGNALVYTARTPVGTYLDTLTSIDGNPNYQLSGINNTKGTLVITPKALSYSIADAASIYGTAATLAAATLNGVVSGDTVSAGPTLFAYDNALPGALQNVGAYLLHAAALTGADSGNYTITDGGSTYGTLTIAPKALTYSMSATQDGIRFTGGTYGALASEVQPSIALQLAGIVGTDAVSLVTSGPGLIPTSTGGNLNAGDYVYAGTGLSGAGAGNYVIAASGNEPLTLRIDKRNATVNLVPTFVKGSTQTVAYYGNGAENAIGVQLVNVAQRDYLAFDTGFVTSSGTATTLPDRAVPGSYSLTLLPNGIQGRDAANYNFTVNSGTLTVQPRPVTVRVAVQTQTYGDQFVMPQGTVFGALSGDDIYVDTSLASSAPDAYGHLGAGTHLVVSTGLLGSQANNYQLVVGGGSSGLPQDSPSAIFTVNRKMLTYTLDPSALNIIYGDTPQIGVLSGILANDLDAVTSFSAAMPLVIHGIASTITYYGGDLYTWQLPRLLDTGTYTYQVALHGDAANNYAVASPGTLTVSPKPVTSVLAAVSTPYGTVSAPVAMSGFINGDSYGTTFATTDANGVSLTYGAQTEVGSYTNHVTGLQTSAKGGELNYVYVDTPSATASLVITPRPLTWTAPTGTVQATYGDAPVLGTLNGVLFGDDTTLQLAGGTGMPSGRLVTDGTTDGVQYYGTRLDVGDYAWSVSGLSGAKSKDYMLVNPGTGTLTVNQREILYSVDTAGAQHGNYQIPITGQYPWTYGASLGAARFANVMSGDTVGGTVALLDLNGNAATLDAKLGVGQYFEVVTGLTGASAKNYKIAATGSQPGIFTITPQLVSYATTSAFYLPGTGYVGTPGTPTLRGPGGAFSDPNLTPIVQVFDSKGKVLTDLTNIGIGRYYFKVVGLTGSDAQDFKVITGSYPGQYAQNDAGTLDVYADSNFGLSFQTAQQQAPVLPAQPAPAPAVAAPPLSGYYSSTNSENTFKFQDAAAGTGTATATSTTKDSAGASGTAQAKDTETVTIDGVDVSLDSSAAVYALAKVGVTGVTLSVGADAHVDVKMTVGAGYVEYGAQADAEAKLSADRKGLQLGASVIIAAVGQAGVAGSIGAAGTGSIDVTNSTFVYAKTDLAATFKDGKVTTTESFQYGSGVSVGTELGLSGKVGSVDAGVTVYSPGSVGVQFNYTAGYSDGALSVSLGYGAEALFGGFGGTLSFSLNIGAEVRTVSDFATKTIDSVGNTIEGWLHLNDSPPPPPQPTPDDLAERANQLEGDPVARYAFLVANPSWSASGVGTNAQFFGDYQALVWEINTQVYNEAHQQAEMTHLISSGDIQGAVALAHSGISVESDAHSEADIQYWAKYLKVHLTASNGALGLADNPR
jgi:filamentous hemagglutinin family protein